jgi:hypothetical protein
MADILKNFSYGHITVAPSPQTTGTTLSMNNADSDDFEDPLAIGYNVVVYPANQIPLSTNAEIVRVTAKGAHDSGGVGHTQFTILRNQEGSSTRSIQVGDQISASVTKKLFDDIYSYIDSQASTGFEYKEHDKTATYVYVGYEHATDGSWYIYRRTRSSGVREYATGASSYATNWTGRAGLTYS